MAEVCAESSEVCEPMTRAARRRRINLGRFQLAGGADSMASADGTKRRKNEKSGLGSESDLTADSGLDPSPRYGVTSVCGRRRDMEDAVSIKLDILEGGLKKKKKHQFFGVFDGHGCSHVAASCRDRMHELVAEEAERLSPSEPPKWKEVMERSFARMDTEVVENHPGTVEINPNCRCELQIPKCDHVGSTAVVAVVNSDQIVVANCGDSRAVLGRKRGALPLSLDHKPDRPDELNRIEAAGGRVIYWDGARVLGVLAMSRAIGDSYLKPFVISEPEVTITERAADDECLILASDGLWDVVSNETACDVVRMCLEGNNPASNSEGLDKACSDAAMLLTKLALARRSADNVSVVVVDLRRNL